MKKVKAFLEGKVVRINNTDCICIVRPYLNGHIFMQLLDKDTSEPIARVSLAIDNIPVIENMIIIKSYAENKGIYEALLDAEIIKPCERMYAIGFENAHICFFNIPIQD